MALGTVVEVRWREVRGDPDGWVPPGSERERGWRWDGLGRLCWADWANQKVLGRLGPRGKEREKKRNGGLG